jgi:YVTN family beta-propeller protein
MARPACTGRGSAEGQAVVIATQPDRWTSGDRPGVAWSRKDVGYSMPIPRAARPLTLALVGLLAIGTALARADTPPTNVHGWTLTPAGRQLRLGDRPYGMAVSPDGRTLVVSNDGQSTESLMVIDCASGEVRQTLNYDRPEALYLGVAFGPDGRRLYASAGGNNKIRVYDVNDQQLVERAPISLPTTDGSGKRILPYPAGLAVSADGKTLFVADNLTDSLTIVDLAAGAVRGTVPVGHNPYAVVLSADGRTAYVSNWGELSVSAVDTASATERRKITVGTHPSALLLNPTRPELYVANSDSDSLSVVDTTSDQAVRTLSLAPYPDARAGSSPNALALSPDGTTLYVANAGNNDIAVVRLGAPDVVTGLIPTAWYPTALALAPDGWTLYVVNAKGLGSGPNPSGPNPYDGDPAPDQFVGSMIAGSLSIVPVPDAATLARYTEQVVGNNGFDERDQARVAQVPRAQIIPRQPGDPSPIKHVIYIIKENRTYDQVLGGLGRGNGDPGLELFGEESAPNHRQLARRFVTLDNFFADAEVSADGWNWSTAALANTYVQKNWPQNYGDRNRPYDFEGGNYATAPGSDPSNAYLWDRLERAGVSYRNYGFWVFNGAVAATAPKLAANTDLQYAGYNLRITDQARVDEWLTEFQQYVDSESLPAVELVRLPNDHTAGTTPNMPTPRAMMADNDLALGRLVEAVSHSAYWPDTAVFVVEDDAQNGPDHVDAHRTVALVLSPYTQTGAVDSTRYTTSSVLRTMELILGLGPMTQFDARATPLLNAFAGTGADAPNLAPYTAITPDQPLDEVNAVDAPLAAESLAMDLSREDLAPERQLNEAIWKSVKGAASSMPEPAAPTSPPASRDDDD